MQNNVSNISFTSNIKFVSNSRYQKIANLPKTIIVEEMAQVKNVQKVKNGAATKDIIFCIAGMAGVIKKFKKKADFIFHWQPKAIFKDTLKEREGAKKIGEKIRNIPAERSLKGFLFGGLSKDYSEENWSGMRMLNFLDNNIKHLKKSDFTVFLFQDSDVLMKEELPQCAFVYHKKNDTCYVNCRKTINEHWHDLLDENQIRDHFGYIKISPEDKIFIGNRQVPNEFWGKSKKQNKK